MTRKGIRATSTSMVVLAFGALVLALLVVPQAQGGGLRSSLVHSSSWHPQYGPPRLLQAAFGTLADQDNQDEDGASIVGLWHVKLVSDGVTSGIPGGIPAGAEVDAGYAAFHSDHTEILNSGGRAPNTGNFCLAVWAKVGPRQYQLNHFGIPFDPTKGPLNSAGSPVGELSGHDNIKENVTLAPNGQSFTGAFTIDHFDESGNHLIHIEGTVTGTRVDVNTPPSSIF